MVRRNARTDRWHPSTDNAQGTSVYGTFSNDSTGGDTFSVHYKNYAWTRIMFALGDTSEYMIVDRSVYDPFVEAGTCNNCPLTLVASSAAVTPT